MGKVCEALMIAPLIGLLMPWCAAGAQVNCTGPNWHLEGGQCVSTDGRWYLGQDNQPHIRGTVSNAQIRPVETW